MHNVLGGYSIAGTYRIQSGNVQTPFVGGIDLNGDGRTSLFKVMVKVDRAKDVLVVAPTISETDPDE